MIKIIVQSCLFIFPWAIRRRILSFLFKWQLDSSSHIGFSIILAKQIVLHEHASIGHLNFCKRIDKLEIGKYSTLGNLNKITGFPTNDSNVTHFKHVTNRKCELIIGSQTGITSNHYFDCNGGIYIGDYTQIAGFGSAFMTHSIDIYQSRQDASSITIGNYCFIGARCMLLKGITIEDRIVISAMSLVNKNLTQTAHLYGGIPAKLLKPIEKAKFFNRTIGTV